MRRFGAPMVPPASAIVDLDALRPDLSPIVEVVARRTAELVLAFLRNGPLTLSSDTAEQLVGVVEAARVLAVGRHGVYRLAERGALPSVKIGSRLRFRIGDLEAFVRERRRSPEGVAAIAKAIRAGRSEG